MVVSLMGCGRLGYDGAPTDIGLVGHWPFDDAVLLTDAFGGNDITCDGAECPTSSGGVLGGGASFDGSSSCANVPTMADWMSPELTMSAWVKTTTMTGPVVVHESGDGCPSPAMELNDGSLGLVQLNTSDSSHNEAWTPIPMNGEWHQVAVRWDGTDQQVFVDGVCLCTATPELAPLDNPEPFTIGCYPGAGSMFSGELDEVRVYDRALDPYEMANLYAVGDRVAPLPIECPTTCSETP